MGRRASSPARRPAAAPAKPKPAANTPAPVKTTAAPAKPAAASAPAPAPVPQAGGGPGLMGMIAANVAGAAAGHVIGRGIADTIFGGREGSAPVEAASSVETSSTISNNNNPCFSNYQMLQKCLNDNGNDIATCQWAYDMFKECKISTFFLPSFIFVHSSKKILLVFNSIGFLSFSVFRVQSVVN